MQRTLSLICAVVALALPTAFAGTKTGASPSTSTLKPETTDGKSSSSTKARLSLDDLMRPDSESPRETRVETPEPLLPSPMIERPEPAASRGQLSLEGIEAGREAVKVAHARERVRALGERFASSCACSEDASCFERTRFDHDEMNQVFAEQADDYESQTRELCGQWSPEIFDVLPEDVQALDEVATRLQQMLDGRSRMHAALDQRRADFRAEERRIRRVAERAEAEAVARAQQGKKRSGFLASVLTMAGGAVMADSLGAQIDPEKLARTSLNVGQAVRNGGGVAGALDAGVRGLHDMASTAVPKVDVSPASAGGDYLADAMANVKRFPEPGAAAGSAAGAAQPDFSAISAPSTSADLADLFSAVGRPGSPSMSEGLSPEAVAEANRALDAGAQMLATGVTPGGPGTDAFGVTEPTTERFEFICKEHSNIPLSDGAGGTKYYYERKVTGVVKYWTPSCGPAFKAYYKAYACNDIDDFERVTADCLAACGAPDCRDAIYERRILGGGR